MSLQVITVTHKRSAGDGWSSWVQSGCPNFTDWGPTVQTSNPYGPGGAYYIDPESRRQRGAHKGHREAP